MSSSTDSGTILCEIRVPRETVNDDVVTVQSWHAAHGERVSVRQLVCSIETSKAVLEVEAEAEGYLEILHAKGAEVPIGELVGRVLSAAPTGAARSAEPAPAPSNGVHAAAATPAPAARSSNRLRDRMDARRDAPAGGSPAAATTDGAAGSTSHELPDGEVVVQTVSKKAQRLIDEHRIDVAAAFAGLGLVREVDVIGYLEARAAAREAASPAPVSPAERLKGEPAIPVHPAEQAQAVNSAYSYTPGGKSKGLLGDAASSAKDRGDRSVLWLAMNYLWRNWLLGHLVRVAPRGVILTLHKWRGVKMGRDVFIDPTAIVETAFPENITIGNDVRITAGCVIMSHIKAPHYLRETGLVPVVLKPVVLEDHCFIGVNSVILPGVTVGKASVVTSGSVVMNNVPPYTMVQGNPARVIKQFPKP